MVVEIRQGSRGELRTNFTASGRGRTVAESWVGGIGVAVVCQCCRAFWGGGRVGKRKDNDLNHPPLSQGPCWNRVVLMFGGQGPSVLW